jgi:probable HAF family extracellular repeat protein
MNTRIGKAFVTIAFTLLFLMAAGTSAQEEKNEHHHYKLVDIAPFGGPNSSFVGGPPAARLLNSSGAAVGGADTPTPDPASCFNFDCYLSYGFKWQDGVASKLHALPGFNSSFPVWVSDSGLVAGISENGIDPLTGGLALEAILWAKDGSITDLGTLGGNDSLANAVNNRGEVVGEALNTIPDPFTGNFFIPGVTQVHAFRWTKFRGMQDIGTLGGTDSTAVFINERGQIAGWSFTNSTVNSTTGMPTQDPFFWANGKMLDLGTLGGTKGFAYALNNRGQVIGISNLPGDATGHPFLWSRPEGMKDLGTLGGTLGFPTYLNDAGEVVGVANTSNDQYVHAFLWRDGVMTDLGTVGSDPESQANGINSRGQIVGSSFMFDSAGSGIDLHGFLWEDGGPIVDLNTLVPHGSGATIKFAFEINDRGEIAAGGTNSNGDTHAFILVPCDEDHEGLEGCDYDTVDAVTETPVPPAQLTHALAAASATKLSPAEMAARFRSMMKNRGQTERFAIPAVRSANVVPQD